MKVSIIIPVYNSEKYLAECLESILKQDSAEYEIICVNDGSEDLSLDIMKEYKKRFNNMTIINHMHKGLSAARNMGLQIATGEYIYFVDSDDIVKEGYIKRAYDLCIANNLDMLLFSFENFCDDTLLREKYKKQINKEKRVMSFEQVIDGPTMIYELLKNNEYYNMVWIQMTKRQFLQKININFKEGIVFEDVVYTYKLLLECKRVICIDEIGYIKRIHSESICGKNESIYNVISMWDNYKNVKMLNLMLDKGNKRNVFISEKMQERVTEQFLLHFQRLNTNQKRELIQQYETNDEFCEVLTKLALD